MSAWRGIITAMSQKYCEAWGRGPHGLGLHFFSWCGASPSSSSLKLMPAYYQKMLKYHMKPSSNHLHPTGDFTFMHDNAPVHTAKMNTRYLQSEQVDVLPWPGQSPDLKPGETLWRFMKLRVQGRMLSNTKDLFEALQNVWRSIPLE